MRFLSFICFAVKTVFIAVFMPKSKEWYEMNDEANGKG